MPQQPLLLRDDNRNSVDRATAYEEAASRRNAIGVAPVLAYLDKLDDESESGPRSHPVEDKMTVAFRHLDVILAFVAQYPGQNSAADGKVTLNARCRRSGATERNDRDDGVEATDNINRIEDVGYAPPAESPEDPVIKRLSDALAATESTDDRHTGICADALRLAIVARMLGLQSEAPRPMEHPGKANEGAAERQMRALQKWRLKRVVEYVDSHLSSKITLLDLALVAGLSRMHFASQFRAATGLRPHEYLLKRRIDRAEELLRQSTMTLVEIALTVGFQTQAHFTTVFKRFVGDTPYQWRNAHCVCGRRSK
jgi:AraC-like DNA-binding protein